MRLMRVSAPAVAAALVASVFGGFAGAAQSQSGPDAPVVREVATSSGTVTVAWDAPAETGGRVVEAYDARWRRSDAAGGAWTVIDDFHVSGPLTADVTGLANGVSYDIEIPRRDQRRRRRLVVRGQRYTADLRPVDRAARERPVYDRDLGAAARPRRRGPCHL